MEAIVEKDIFKYLVLREENSKDERESVMKSVSIFNGKIPHNIFKNEYYVLYEAITKAKKYGTVLTYNQLYQVIINNINKLIQSPNITREDFSESPHDERQVKEELAELCMVTYEELKSEDLIDLGELRLNTELYLRSWASEEIQRILAIQHEIAGPGKKVKGKHLQGVEDAHSFYTEQYGKIKQMITEEVDRYKNIIRTDNMSLDDINKRFKEDSISQSVAFTGIDGADEHLGSFRKGDLVSIMGQPGAGKTRFSANIMYNALATGNNVLWFPLEGNALQAFTLLVSRHILETNGRIFELDDRKIFDQTYEEEFDSIVDTAILDLLRNENIGKLQIRNVPLYDDEVMLELEAIWEEGFHFDLLCIDYVSLVMSRTNEPTATYLSRLVKQLKNSSMSFKNSGFLLLLPHQLTREVILGLMRGEDATIVGSSDTAEVIKSSDISLALSRTEEQELRDMMSVHFTKTRFAKSIPTLEIVSLHGQCYFIDKPED